MGKNKVRVKNKSKGERWAKGQSSNSNPSKTKFRQAAKSRFFNQGSTEGSKLTTAALLRHDAAFGVGVKLTSADIDVGAGAGDPNLKDATDMTHKTFDTFASDWSGCTNVAFDKVLQKFKASRSGDKEMLAVLAAVTEVIKSQGGKETETEYFAALMTTLDVTPDELHLAAVLRLLAVVIKKVPHPVLISRFSQINSSFVEKLSLVTETANVSVLRALLGCMSVLLRVQPGSVWSLPETKRSLATLLSFTCHSKPKIRKAAQHSVVSVVRGSDPDLVPHPSAAHVSQYCVDTVSASGPQDNSVLYMLTMMKEVLPVLPKSSMKSSCEMVLKLLTLGTPILVTTCFSALHGLFSGRPSLSCLTVEMNGQLLTALADFRPQVHDTAPMVAWLATMQEGLINLGLNSKQYDVHLLKYCQNILECWLSDRAEVVKAGGVAIGAVLSELGRDVTGSLAQKLVELLGQGLKYNYNRAWQTVLSVLAITIEVLGEKNPECMKPLLVSLAQLRASPNFSFEGEVDQVIGRGVSILGPRRVLEAIPLNITGEETDYEFKTSWLLPIFRENIKNTELAFFVDFFLPLAAKCLSRSNASAAQGDTVGHKTYEVLVYQIWSLLPGFCNCPTDLTVSFKSIAKILGVQLGQRKEIRLDILASLRQLISRNLCHEENKSEIARYSKNFLPILFNLYTSVPTGSEEAGQRLASLETIKLFLQISDNELLSTMFDRALDKFTSETAQFTKDAINDLLRCMMPHVNQERLGVLYKEVVSRLNSKDYKEQKKAYRVLEEMCKCTSDDCKKFVVTTLPSLQVQLLSSLSSASPSSQAPRLRCLIHLISGMEEAHPDFVLSVIPEAILSIRAVNSRARAASFSLLIVVGEALQRWSDEENSDSVVRKFMGAVLAGLAGTPNMINCTILAISRIYFTFREQFPDDLAEQVLNNMLVLLKSSSREVSGASLSFIKVFITATPILSCTKYVSNIVKGLVEMSDDCKRHFRLKTKFLYERLVRKFGWEFVSSLVPKSDETTHKRLKNMRKDLARRARKQSEDSGNDEEDFGVSKRHKTIDEILADSSDEEDLFDDEPSSKKVKEKRSKKSGQQTWIHEGSEGIVDLLSSSAAQAVSSTNPNLPKSSAEKSKKSNGFKINSDGKFVITEDSDDDNTASNKRSHRFDELDSDSDEETFEDLVNTKKRKMGSSETGSMKSARSGVSGKSNFSKYTTGGSGIHRDTSKDLGSEYKNKSGRGDVKKVGKHDPYAYIPLNHKNLNKRKAAKNKGQFKNVISAARKGAMKGNKSKVKDVKKLMKNMNI